MISSARRRAAATSATRLNAPTITLSSVLSPAKGCTIWKVRASPRRQIACGLSPTMDAPLKRMAPDVGA
jgi:hypothetical protein